MKVFIDSQKPTPNGRLKGTLGSASTVELCGVIVSDLINDIAPPSFDEVIFGYLRND